MHHIRHLCTVGILVACRAAALAFQLEPRSTQNGSSGTGPENSDSWILSNSSIGSPLNTRFLTERLLHCDGDRYGRGLEDWSCLEAANNFWTMRQIISFGPRGSIAYMKTPWRISSRESQHKPTKKCGVMSAYMRPLSNSGRKMCF